MDDRQILEGLHPLHNGDKQVGLVRVGPNGETEVEITDPETKKALAHKKNIEVVCEAETPSIRLTFRGRTAGTLERLPGNKYNLHVDDPEAVQYLQDSQTNYGELSIHSLTDPQDIEALVQDHARRAQREKARHERAYRKEQLRKRRKPW